MDHFGMFRHLLMLDLSLFSALSLLLITKISIFTRTRMHKKSFLQLHLATLNKYRPSNNC
jgi:hypothetical protein